MNGRRALLYARTIRHLRPVQVVGRVWRAVRTPRVDTSPAPPRRTAMPMLAPAERLPVLVAPSRVRMLGEEADLASSEAWDDPARSALWRYHVHYFDDLRATGAESREAWNLALIERWIAENEPGRGTGWDAYPASLRIVNWVRFDLARGRLSPQAVHSIAVQARYLRATLEHHLLGNHLLANAKALVFAGAYFDGPEAAEWLAKGLELVAAQLAEQVMSDGGHFERSAMYHSLVLEDVLDLIALQRAVPRAFDAPAEWSVLARAMLRWLAVMRAPDGEIALFNDAAIGQAPAPAALEAYAARLGVGACEERRERVVHLAATGYVRVVEGDLVVHVDVGEIGPAYLPGHAHADSLSFEASIAGARWIVDTGTSLYEPGAERLRQRSTAAHNTVEVDGESSSEVWSSFRVARRARPRGLAIEERAGEVRVECAHDGYRRLPGRPTHRRRWTIAPGCLAVRDTVTGTFASAVARLHLHPDVVVDAAGAELAHAAGIRATCDASGAARSVEASTWHPRFGSSVPSSRLAFRLESPEAEVRLTW